MLRGITSNCRRGKWTKPVGEENCLIPGLTKLLVMRSIIPKVVDKEWSNAMYEVMNDLRFVNSLL